MKKFTEAEKNLSEQRLIQYEKLFYRVMEDCGVYQDNPDYDDYLQILRLDFAGWIIQQEAVEIGYLYKFLVWRLRDAQRSAKRDQDQQNKLIERSKYELQSPSLSEYFWLQEIEALLEPEEMRYLTSYLFIAKNKEELTKLFQHTYPTARKKLSRIREKLRHFKE